MQSIPRIKHILLYYVNGHFAHIMQGYQQSNTGEYGKSVEQIPHELIIQPQRNKAQPKLCAYFKGLMQKRSNLIDNAMELHLFCIKPLILWNPL